VYLPNETGEMFGWIEKILEKFFCIQKTSSQAHTHRTQFISDIKFSPHSTSAYNALSTVASAALLKMRPIYLPFHALNGTVFSKYKNILSTVQNT